MVEGLRLHPRQLQEGKPRSFGTSTGPRGSPAPLAPHGFAWIRSREVTRGLNRGGLGSDQCTGEVWGWLPCCRPSWLTSRPDGAGLQPPAEGIPCSARLREQCADEVGAAGGNSLEQNLPMHQHRAVPGGRRGAAGADPQLGGSSTPGGLCSPWGSPTQALCTHLNSRMLAWRKVS